MAKQMGTSSPKKAEQETATKKTTVVDEQSAFKTSQVNEENEQLKSEIEQLKKMIAEMASASKPTTVVQNVGSRMDAPCTLIHMLECTPGLNTTITVNNIPHIFSKFGERRTFRFAEMQNIVARYRDWFDRGVFALGEDCSEFAEEFGLEIMEGSISVRQFDKIANLPTDEFERIFKGMNMSQRVVFANSWTHKYETNPSLYGDIAKLRVMNDLTDNFLKSFMERIVLDK